MNKIYISEETDKKLRVLKARTGLTPNLLIRIGLVYSLEEDGLPDKTLYGNDQFREFNRYTLTGQWDLYFTALLRERIILNDGDPQKDFEDQFKAHIARGVHLIYQRLKSLEDIGALFLQVQKKLKLRSTSLDETIEDLVDGKRPIYMDHHATTPVDPRVLEVMLPYFSEFFGNAASTDHVFGNEANAAVEKARGQIGDVIGAKPEEIVFTSGSTESNNLAIKGVAEQYTQKGNHIITCVTEHPAVLDPCRKLERKGFEVPIHVITMVLLIWMILRKQLRTRLFLYQ